jgi:hypothetical protein
MPKNLYTRPLAARQGGLFGLAGQLETSPEVLSEQGVKPKSEPLATKRLSARECFLVAATLEFYGGLANGTRH